MKNKRLGIYAVIIISLLSLGVYTLKYKFNLPAVDPNPSITVKDAEFSANAEGTKASQVPKHKTPVTEPQRQLESVDAKASTIVKNEPLSEKEVKDLLIQFDSYRQNPSYEAVCVLSSYLENENRILALEAILVLQSIALTGNQQEAVLEILIAKATDPSYFLRDRALYAVASIAKEDMLPIIDDYIDISDENFQTENYNLASRALAIIRNQHTIPYLEDLLSKVKDPDIRHNCYDTLAAIDSYESLLVLKIQIQVAQGSDQIAGVKALARTQNPETVEFLSEAIQEQKFSAETIDRLSYSPVAPDVFGLLLNNNLIAKEQKIELLNTLAEHSVEGNRNLRRRMTDMLVAYIETNNSSEMKARAIRVVGALGEERAPEIMQSFFNSEDATLREEAFFNFVNYTNPSNYTSLFDFLWDEDEEVRRTAIVSLERFANYGDIEMLEKAALHNDVFIREHASTLLSELN